VVEITHPFHPLQGQRFSFIERWRNWGGDRVLFQDETGGVRSVPTAWTNVAAEDPFVAMSRGRALFRTEDLVALAEVIRGVRAGDEGRRGVR
jgi:hypothetical protein